MASLTSYQLLWSLVTHSMLPPILSPTSSPSLPLLCIPLPALDIPLGGPRRAQWVCPSPLSKGRRPGQRGSGLCLFELVHYSAGCSMRDKTYCQVPDFTSHFKIVPMAKKKKKGLNVIVSLEHSLGALYWSALF